MSVDGINPVVELPPGVIDQLLASGSGGPEVAGRPAAGEAEPAQQEKAVEETTKSKLTAEQIEESMKALNDRAKRYDISLRFRIDREISRIIVTVFDKTNDEVIRQVPPEDLVELSKRIIKMTGLIFNDTA